MREEKKKKKNKIAFNGGMTFRVQICPLQISATFQHRS